MSVLCLGEVWLELNAATAPELTETFRAQTGGWGADFCRQYAALGGQAALLAQLGADPFGRKLAARLARDGVDCSLLCFTDAFPTPVVFTGEDTALPYRAHTAGLALGPEQLEAAPFRGASAFCFSSAGLVTAPCGWLTSKPLPPPGMPGRSAAIFPGWRRPRPTGRSGRPCARPPCSFLTGQTFSF